MQNANPRFCLMKSSLSKESQQLGAPENWVDLYGDFLYNYAYVRLKDEAAAEDVVQETYLAALESNNKFAGESTLKTWLIGILRHKIADHLRLVFRQSSADESALSLTNYENTFCTKGKWTGHWIPEQVPTSWGDDPAKILEQKEFWEALDGCLKKLPLRLHSVFVLYQMEEHTTEEICKELEVTPTNLWVMLHRSRLRLRRCLELNWAAKHSAL